MSAMKGIPADLQQTARNLAAKGYAVEKIAFMTRLSPETVEAILAEPQAEKPRKPVSSKRDAHQS